MNNFLWVFFVQGPGCKFNDRLKRAPATQEYMGKHGLTEAWDIEDFVSLSKTLKVPHQDPRGGGSYYSIGTHEIIVEIV